MASQKSVKFGNIISRKHTGWDRTPFTAIAVVVIRMRKTGPMAKTIDSIDRLILQELQADGRMTNVELAHRAGISPPPCLRRVKALEDRGYIRGYRSQLDSKKLGFDVEAFALVNLDSQSDFDLRAFEAYVEKEPLVRDCWMMAGETDFILRCIARDVTTFQDLVGRLTAAPHVRNVKTALVLHQSKDAPGVPFELLPT